MMEKYKRKGEKEKQDEEISEEKVNRQETEGTG